MRRLLTVALLAFFLPLLGCDEAPEPIEARLRLIHGVPDVGNLEVLIDGTTLMTVKPGELSPEGSFDVGFRRLGLRIPGAPNPFKELSLDFQKQFYFVVLTGSFANSSVDLFTVDQAPPSNLGSKAAVELVSLYEGPARFDVYLGELPLVTGLAYRQITPFEQTLSGSFDLMVYNAGDDPAVAVPVTSKALSLAAGKAYMVLLQAGAGRSVQINSLAVN